MHRMDLFDPTTWLVPAQKKPIIADTSRSHNWSTISSASGNRVAPADDGNGQLQLDRIATISDQIEKAEAFTHEFPLSFKLRLVLVEF